MSDLDTSVDHILLDRYVAGECTLAERHLVERWAAANPDNERRLAKARLIQERFALRREASQAATAWHSVSQQIKEAPSTFGEPARILPFSHYPAKGLPVPAWGALAALLVMVSGIGGLMLARHRGGANQSFMPGLQYVTAVGEQQTMRLEDGTRITLAPGSRMRVAKRYGQGVRQIELEGEAYFTVVHDAAHPFSVRTSTTLIRDIGTAFDVKAYASDGHARVAVAEGAVTVARSGCVASRSRSGCTATLRGGDILVLEDSSMAVTHLASVDRYIGWMQGRLVFDGAPLREVVQDLERMFGTEIRIADSTMARRPVTGTFDKVPVDQVLQEISLALGAHIERRGHVLVISSQSADSLHREGPAPRPLATALGTE